MISRLWFMIPVIQKSGRGQSLTRANGAQVGRALPAFLQIGRCSGGVGAEPACCLKVEMFACLSGVERTLSGRARTAPDPSFSVSRQVQPAETPTSSPYCSQIFISALFVPGRPAADNPPRCVSGTGRDVTTRAANRSLQTLLGGTQAPQTLQLIAFSLLRHAGASTT